MRKGVMIVAGVMLTVSLSVSACVVTRAEPVSCKQLVDSYIASSYLEEVGLQEIPAEIQEAADKYGTEYSVSPELIISMAWQESRFQQYAKGGSCCGVMQVNPKVHADRMKRLGVSDIYDIDGNIHVAVDYLSELSLRYEDAGLVLLAYNGASTALKEKRLTKYATGILKMSEALERVNGK